MLRSFLKDITDTVMRRTFSSDWSGVDTSQVGRVVLYVFGLTRPRSGKDTQTEDNKGWNTRSVKLNRVHGPYPYKESTDTEMYLKWEMDLTRKETDQDLSLSKRMFKSETVKIETLDPVQWIEEVWGPQSNYFS